MNYRKMLQKIQYQQPLSNDIDLHCHTLSEGEASDWSEIVRAKVVEERNMHGDGHRDNIYFEFTRAEDDFPCGNLWITQFIGP